MNLFVGLIVFVCVMLLIAAIGHGIWVVLAAILSAVFGPPTSVPHDAVHHRRRRRVCPGCEATLLPTDRDCPRCGLDLISRLATDVERVRFALREVTALTERGELDAETSSLVAARLAERIRTMVEVPPAQPASRHKATPVSVLERPLGSVPPLFDQPIETAPRSEELPPVEATLLPTPEPVEPPVHRGGMLTAFMEEKNILWGELVGGLLIVGCSIALVLTLWRSLEALPYFPFLLSTAITAALFGAGQYTLHHWKLASTSRGLLVIALLLAPLNLLLLATPGTATAGGWLDVGVKLFALVAFVGIVRASGRDLIGTDLLPGPVSSRWLLALAVVGTPASQSIHMGEWSSLSAWLPLACHVIACGSVLSGLTWYRRRDEQESLGERQSSALAMFVGISAFALFAAWGSVLIRSAELAITLNSLSLPLVIAGIPILEAGLLVQRRLVPGHAGLRATGTGVALAGSGLLATGVLLAWPHPLWLTLVSAVVGAQFTRIAWRDALPWFHLGAVPALGLACVLGVHGLTGHWAIPDGFTPSEWLRHQIAASTSGIVLAAFALVLAGIGVVVARRENRPQGVGYALGAAISGIVALLLVNGHGPDEPWPAFGVHLACAVGLLASNVYWKKRVAAQAGVWLVLVATLWFLFAVPIELPGSWGCAIALEALTLAALAVGLTPRAARPGRVGIVFGQFRIACRDVSATAGLLAVALSITSVPFLDGLLHTITFLALAPTALLLARVFVIPAFTLAGSAFGLVGLLHLTIVTTHTRPIAAAVLLALLGHATLSAGITLLFRKRRSYVRLFADPLRQTARLSTCLAVPFLILPASGFALAWAGFALWLAVLWYFMAWKWKERGAFSAGQGSLAIAAVLCGLVWVERQDWWLTTTQGPGDPRALQVFGLALGVLALGWVAARRLLQGSERLRELWFRDPFSIDRIVTAVVVVGQLLLLVLAIESPLRDEHTPIDQQFWSRGPSELLTAFGSTGWLLLGLLSIALAASLRLRTDDEPQSDGTLIGLVILGLSVPVMWAGSFAPELASASALRWGLAVGFVAGSCVVYFREQLGALAVNAGFPLRTTSLATRWAYGLFAVAAGVAVLLTFNIAVLGLKGLKPSGPEEGSIFARMGWTISAVVPMALVVIGLAGTAVRERLAGYAFAAGVVFVGTVTGGYALGVVTSGGTLDSVELMRLGMIAVGSAALWALAWLAAERYVPGDHYLSAHSVLMFIGASLLGIVPLFLVLYDPVKPLPAAFAELGQFGWLVLALAGWAAFEHAGRSAPRVRGHVIGFTGMIAGVLAACAVQPLDEPGSRLSFFALAGVWVVVGLAFTALLFRVPQLSRGVWLKAVAVGVFVLAARNAISDGSNWVAPALAVYALLVALVAALLSGRADELDEGTRTRWNAVIHAEAIVAGITILLAIIASVTGSVAERLAGPLAFLLLAAATGVLSSNAPAALSPRLRFVAMLAAAFGVALVGWAIPEPDAAAVWLQRNGWAFVALVAGAVACLEFVPKLLRDSAWATDARRVGGGLVGAAILWLVIVLLQQIPDFSPVTRRTPLELPAVLMILAGIGVLIAFALRFALRPALDPLQLPERRRTAYVYLAEVLLVLFFVHIRFNLPELFLGQAVRYWTFIVMLLAFVGVGLAEFFERKGVNVLAVPLRRTGVLLPLIPLLAFWAKPPGLILDWADSSAPGMRPLLGYLEKLPQEFDRYAALWCLAGAMYGYIALRRQSFGWALLAALSANAGMWALLAHNDVSAAVHPQVWVIPLSLIILVSEHINRRELRREVSNGLRYIGIGMLYLSSAADLFIAGVGESIWLPVVLAVFCVAGIFAGIMLRVRAFLFLGAGFLLLNIFAMIWHAAVDREQTWVWYVSGIVLGAAILTLFAIFEKRKNDVHAVVDRLRRWD